MHPVLAREEIQIAELHRRQRLAEAERKRQMAAGIAVQRGGAAPAATGRLRDLLLGVVAGLSLFRTTRGGSIRDDSAAIRSA